MANLFKCAIITLLLTLTQADVFRTELSKELNHQYSDELFNQNVTKKEKRSSTIQNYNNGFQRNQEEHWDIRNNIPGEPDVDYPIYSIPPETSFSCYRRHDGYYADVEARCQVFRVCGNTDLTGKGFAFLCPNGTLFNQKYFICDWYHHVDCTASENFYFKNTELGTVGNINDIMSMVQRMVDYTKQTGPNPTSLTDQNKMLINNQLFGQTGAKDNLGGGSISPLQRTPAEISSKTRTTDNRAINNPNKNGNQYQPGNIFVSNLGELSTESGKRFNPFETRRLLNPSNQNGLNQRPLTESTTISSKEKFIPTANGNSRPILNNAAVEQTNLPQNLNRLPQKNDQPSLQARSQNNAQNTKQLVLPYVINSLGEIRPFYPGTINNLPQTINLQRTSDGTFVKQEAVQKDSSQADSKTVFSSDLEQQNNGKQIYSGSGDLLGQSFGGTNRSPSKPFNINQQNYQTKQGQFVGQGVQGNRQTYDGQQKIPIYSGEGDLLGQSFGLNKFTTASVPVYAATVKNEQQQTAIYSGEGDLLQQSFGRHQKPATTINTEEQRKVIYSGEGDLLGQSFGRQQKPTSATDQVQQQKTVYSGEGDLLQQSFGRQQKPTIGTDQLKQQKPIYSGEGDLLQQSFGRQQKPNQVQPQKPIYSGEGDLLQQSFGRQQKPNQVQQQKPIYSGEGDLLQQSFGGQQKPDQVQQQKPIYSGEGDLLQQSFSRQQTLGQVQQQKPVYRGEGDLLQQSFSRQQKPDQVRQQKPIYSGEGDLLQQSFGRQQKPIYSGEGDLLQQSFGRQQKPDQFQQQKPIYSGEGDLLQQSFGGQRRPTNTIIPSILSGDGNLMSHTINEGKSIYASNGQTLNQQQQSTIFDGNQDSLKQVPINNRLNIATQHQTTFNSNQNSFTNESLSTQSITKFSSINALPIFSGEGDLLSQSLINRRPTFNNGQPVYTGEGNLLGQSFGKTPILNRQLVAPNLDNSAGRRQEPINSKSNNVYIASTTPVPSATQKNIQSQLTYSSQSFGDSLSKTITTSSYNQIKLPLQQTPVYSGEGNLLGQSLGKINLPTKIGRGQAEIVDQSQFSKNLNGTVVKQSVSSSTSVQQQQKQFYSQSTITGISKPIYSGEGNLVQGAFNGLKINQQTLANNVPVRKVNVATPSRGYLPVIISKSVKSSVSQQRAPIRSSESKESKQVYTYPVNKVDDTTTKPTANNYYPTEATVTAASQQSYTIHKFQDRSDTANLYYNQQYAAIENRPVLIRKNLQYPSIQNNYPKQIQNNNLRYFNNNYKNNQQQRKSISSSSSVVIPPALPSIVHPISAPQSTSFNSYSQHLLQSSNKNNNNNEQVIVQIIPSNGWYLNDAEERKSYFQAVSQGLLNENGNIYVNNVQKINNNAAASAKTIHQHVTEPSESTDLAEDIYFTGPSSYQLPISSVGKLACDSDSVSNLNNNFGDNKSKNGVDNGYRYDPPCKRYRL